MFDLAPYRLSVNLSELARKCRISLVRWPLADPLGCFPVDAILPETKHAGSLNLGKTPTRSGSRSMADPSSPVCSGLVSWAQPQRDMGGLHRLLDHCYQFLTQLIQVHLMAQRGTESSKCAGRIILAPVEAAVNAPLDAPPHRLEQGGYGQGRADDGPLVLQRLPDEPTQEELQQRDTAEVDQGQ